MKPRLLDLFCGAGGAAVGYHRAGFEVIGVDIEPQPNYPFPFMRVDALDYLREIEPGDYDAIHASPPCQAYSAATGELDRSEYPDLIASVRSLLEGIGLPYVIENVEGAPLLNPTMLCGSSFGMEIRRHRLFETNFALMVAGCSHGSQRQVFSVTGNGYGGKHRGHNATKPRDLAHGKKIMGIEWKISIVELSNALPPAYTEHIGGYLMVDIKERRRRSGCQL